MIDFSAEILSGKSIGNILLGANISEYLHEMYASHEVEVKQYRLPNGEARCSYSLGRVLTIATHPDGLIFSIGCNRGYKGRYKACLYPGQTMDEVSKATERQRIFNGSVIINDDFGFSFVLPAPYDEVADHIGDIPPGLVLDEVYVSDFSMWNPHR
ncbi:hypothetical protein HI806_25195 (plasmid) [Ralstonia solanacearum]|uniref:Hypothethical protein n=1 Tax=Ralstonia solanacearum TaxID=305 RepID=A0A0S4V911_RALSL|nr:hypothetical protein [Ralstonia pseudosolanacearum]APF89653.1 hypothetical protein BCR16_22945 [Ralstonia solanacearum FJAT-1458]AXW59946.1 hypothetical protein CJO93_21905 [Ralstonia solanacearum]MCK4122031.1 hypothetical protein [Ralstonia pseudosolanacearum]MCK4151333.1 hypothetical protein [Ralstonia pseudosolanacearum]QIK20657.1 hypothetical protein G7968_19515 [Ralstonia solanacearum]